MPGSNLKVLIADDEEALLEVLVDLLIQFGCVVYQAKDGLAALEIIKKEYLDVVLTDIQMPKLDGFNLLVAAKDFNKSLPVYVMTASSNYSKHQLLQAGASDVFYKPFDSSVILSLFRNFKGKV